MDIPYRVPGTDGPDLIVRRSALGNLSVLVDGQPIKGRGFTYPIPLPDGTTTELRLSGQWSGLKAIANGVETVLEPPVNPIFTVLVFVPIVLVVLGGVIGGVIGVLAAGGNLALSRRPLRAPVKLLAMLGMIAAAAVVWFGIAIAITPLPKLVTGTCINGITEGATLTEDTYRTVDCATSHDNEVIGVATYTAGGSFPGLDPLVAFAQQPCLDAFRTYVGIDFQQSVLQMIVIAPNDLRWAKGDRDLACVVIGPNNAPLTGSVKGTAR